MDIAALTSSNVALGLGSSHPTISRQVAVGAPRAPGRPTARPGRQRGHGRLPGAGLDGMPHREIETTDCPDTPMTQVSHQFLFVQGHRGESAVGHHQGRDETFEACSPSRPPQRPPSQTLGYDETIREVRQARCAHA